MTQLTLKDFAFWALLAVIAALPISISFFEIAGTLLIGLALISIVKNKNYFYVVDSEEKLRKVFQWFLVVAVVICADALLQGITGFEVLRQRPLTDYFGETKRLTGPFSHANNFSAYLSFVVILFLGIVHEGRKLFSIQRYAFFLLGFIISFLFLK